MKTHPPFILTSDQMLGPLRAIARADADAPPLLLHPAIARAYLERLDYAEKKITELERKISDEHNLSIDSGG